jgi:hypothetical protein
MTTWVTAMIRNCALMQLRKWNLELVSLLM